MRDAQTYQIRIYDRPIAQFEFERSLTGFRARGLEVSLDASHLLPLNIAQSPDDIELNRFLESRRIPKGRVYLEELLRPFGLAPSDTKGIIDLSRGTSVNDAYSVIAADDDIPYRDYNLFDNGFDEILQVIAYTGVIPNEALGNGRPSDLTPSGSFPKTWRRLDGRLVLYKAGSVIAAPNYGREPYSEALAWQVAKTARLQAVEYGLTEWRGRLCSTCELFNTPDVSFTPFSLCMPSSLLQLCDFELVQAYFADLGEEALQAFKSMAVFDSVIANADRHPGNFGVLRDNETGKVLGMAPLFDHNMALFPRDLDTQMDLDSMAKRAAIAPGIFETPLLTQGEAALGEEQRTQLERLLDFTFEDGGFIEEYRANHPDGKTMSAERLKVLGTFVRARACSLLESMR